jgi:hypothetical protein
VADKFVLVEAESEKEEFRVKRLSPFREGEK